MERRIVSAVLEGVCEESSTFDPVCLTIEGHFGGEEASAMVVRFGDFSELKFTDPLCAYFLFLELAELATVLKWSTSAVEVRRAISSYGPYPVEPVEAIFVYKYHIRDGVSITVEDQSDLEDNSLTKFIGLEIPSSAWDEPAKVLHLNVTPDALDAFGDALLLIHDAYGEFEDEVASLRDKTPVVDPNDKGSTS